MLGAVAFAAFSLTGHAAIILDNADPPLSTTTRISSLEGVAAYLQIGTADVSIGQIAINAQPLQNGQLKFVIFSDVAPPGSDSGTLLFSDTVNVSASNSLSYILSDPLAFTLLAGHYYDIGSIFSGTGISYTYDLTPDVQNGITTFVSNQNVDSFADPILAGRGASDVSIRLYSGSAAATPEPGSYLLAILGLASVGFIRYSRRLSNAIDVSVHIRDVGPDPIP